MIWFTVGDFIESDMSQEEIHHVIGVRGVFTPFTEPFRAVLP